MTLPIGIHLFIVHIFRSSSARNGYFCVCEPCEGDSEVNYEQPVHTPNILHYQRQIDLLFDCALSASDGLESHLTKYGLRIPIDKSADKRNEILEHLTCASTTNHLIRPKSERCWAIDPGTYECLSHPLYLVSTSFGLRSASVCNCTCLVLTESHV